MPPNAYEPVAGTGGGGLHLEARHFIALAEIGADNARKSDSATGHGLNARARFFYRIGKGWYAGAGPQWNKLVADHYSRQAWRPAFGVGKDVFRPVFSLRAQVMYVLPGTDRANAVQGPELMLWLPSPATHRHLFWRQTIGIYEYHQTSVPGNPGTQNRSVATYVDFQLMYRF